MKYFVYKPQINRSCCYEFYKGKWDGRTFWKEDSIYIDDDVWADGFVDAVIEVVPTYDPFGETEISIFEWEKIGEGIREKDIKSQVQYAEADAWAKKAFEACDCFTILGL